MLHIRSICERMKASSMKEFKDTAKLQLLETRTPTLEADEVLIRVRGAAISKMDLFEHEKDDVLIRECSGRVIKVGRSVTRWRIGDKVCALLNERGYAEDVVVSSKCVLPAPSCIPLVDAAQLPLVTCNCYYAINKCLELRKGEVLVIHDVFFHFTLFAIARAKSCGLRVLVVTGFDSSREVFKQSGADVLIDSRKENIVEQVHIMSGMKGANAVLSYGANKITEYSQCLAKNGVILLVYDGQQKKLPEVEEVSLGHLTSSCARIKVCNIESLMTSLDKNSLESLVCEVEQHVWPDIESGVAGVAYEKVAPSEMATVRGVIEKLGTEKVILTTRGLSMTSKVLSKISRLVKYYVCY